MIYGVSITKLVIMNLSVLICAIIAFIILNRRALSKQKGTFNSEQLRKANNKYSFYSTNIFTRKRIRRIAERYSVMSCYDVQEVKLKSVKLFEKTILFCIGLPILVCITLQDLFIAIVSCLVSYIYYDISVDKEIDRVYKEILLEVGQAIQSIRTSYMQTNNIPKAVLYSEKGQHLENVIKQIYDILVDNEPDKKLDDFCRRAPIRILKTLARCCCITNNYGDTIDPVYGSAFQQELTLMRIECDAEYNRLENTRIAFKSLAGLSLLGICMLPIAQWYLLSKIPGTSVLLKGSYGAVVRILIVGITAVAYYVISIINRPSVVNQVDVVEWIDNLGHKYRKIIHNIMPKDFKSVRKIKNLLDDALSSQTPEYLYTKKLLNFFVWSIVSVLLIFGYMVTIKSAIWNNYGALTFTPMTAMTVNQLDSLKKIDNEVLKMDDIPGKEALAVLYKRRVKNMSELDSLYHANRVAIKYKIYHGANFKWYFPLIVFLCGIMGWCVPNMTITFRRKLVIYESTEDVLQLQNLMIVLSNTTMNVRRALFWLTKQSTVHKAVLRLAYCSFASDPEGSLTKLLHSVRSLEFKRMILNLKTSVCDLTLKDAFSNLILDKDQTLTARERTLKEELESKKQWAKLISVAPAAIAIVFYFIGPILYLGFTQLFDTFANMKM